MVSRLDVLAAGIRLGREIEQFLKSGGWEAEIGNLSIEDDEDVVVFSVAIPLSELKRFREREE